MAAWLDEKHTEKAERRLGLSSSKAEPQALSGNEGNVESLVRSAASHDRLMSCDDGDASACCKALSFAALKF